MAQWGKGHVLQARGLEIPVTILIPDSVRTCSVYRKQGRESSE